MAMQLIQLLKVTFFCHLTLTLTLHLLLHYSHSSLSHSTHALLLSLSSHQAALLSLLWCAAAALFAYSSTRPLPVFLLGYSCFKPDDDRKAPYDVCEYFGLLSGHYTTDAADFMRYIYRRSGLGSETYVPPAAFHPHSTALLPFALQEVEESMYASAAALLSKTDVRPDQITLLVVAASAFSPSPSLSSFLVHHLRLPDNVKTLSLAGMGCSAGTLLVDLAARILRHRPGVALVVATDATGLNWYRGNDRHMLVTNCIFRAGTAAALLASGPNARPSAKMELILTHRTHHGASDQSYNAAVQQEDSEGLLGIYLSKDLIHVAGAALREHISSFAPRVLPVTEMVRYVWSVGRAYAAGGRKAARGCVPDFTAAFEHMCVHAGGKAVIDGIERMMRLPEEVTEPARMCLHRFGNTSSSLVYYEMAYMEAKGRVRAGDRVWMLGFGSGFKACSVVWRALQDSCLESDNPWVDCIHRYPVDLSWSRSRSKSKINDIGA